MKKTGARNIDFFEWGMGIVVVCFAIFVCVAVPMAENKLRAIDQTEAQHMAP